MTFDVTTVCDEGAVQCAGALFLNIYIYATDNDPFDHTAQRKKLKQTRMWANAQRDGRPGEHRWRPLFNAAKFG